MYIHVFISVSYAKYSNIRNVSRITCHVDSGTVSDMMRVALTLSSVPQAQYINLKGRSNSHALHSLSQ